MRFFEVLWAEAQGAYTPWLVLLTMVAFVAGRLWAGERPRLKAMVLLLVGHLVGLVATAGFVAAGGGLADSLRTPSWVFGVATFVGACANLLFAVLLPRLRLHTPLIVQDVVVGLGMVASSLAVLSHAGVNLSGLIATSAVFTAILGFSLQDVIGNVAGGLALQVDGALEEGDWIKVGDVTGRVVEIRWRYTAVETRNWETVLVPNTVMTKSNVVVLGRRRGQAKQLRRWVFFNVDWRYQPGDVIDVVQTALRAAQLQRVAREPPPNVVLMDMAETYGKYAVRYWLTDIAVDDPTDSDVRACVYFALKRADMSLALPAHAIFVTEESQDRKDIKTEKQVQRRLELLAKIELFSVLSEDERTELAKGMRYAPFAKGEVMTRQGAEAHWLYLVEDGSASVRVSDGEVEREVAKMQGPTFFGEMSLLTGDPRSATVIAEGEIECFRLDKAAVQKVLAARPELAGQLAQLLAHRKTAIQAAREGLSAEAARARAEREANALKTRIRAFFALD